MKKVVSVLLIVLLFGSVCLFPVSAYGGNNVMLASSEESEQSVDLSQYSISQEISANNIRDVIDEYDIPREVALSLLELMLERPTGKTVTVYIPEDTPGETAGTNGLSPYWSPTREYMGRTLQNYVITIENAFYMTEINRKPTTPSFLDFCEDILVYVAGEVVDTIVAFVEAKTKVSLTLLEFLIYVGSIDSETIVTAGYGDKLSVAPMYMTFETYVYVLEGGEKIFGAKVYATYLMSISWYYYNSNIHDQFVGIQKYTVGTIDSANYGNSNLVAVQNYNIGGWVDDPVAIQVGDKLFVCR